ncbi:MAG: rhomboid family intramembrane serine protease [Xanthomonadales bacterium]|nr:rhomboid family intramembrane serine protease [Xanthomonadales bacterium]
MFVHVPSRRKPRPALATYALVLLSVAMFAAWWLQEPMLRAQWLQRFGVLPGDWIGLGHPGAGLSVALVSRLATALFLHVDALHLIGNLVFLVVFGVSAERPLGAWRLLLLFVACGMLANAVGAAVFSAQGGPIIGSSGAVSALVGAYVTLFPRSRLGLVVPLGAFLEFVRMPAYGLIGLWVLVQALMYALTPAGASIAWPVHLAGFVSGVAYALLSRAAIARRLRN